MRRQIRWVERLDDGVKRKIAVSFRNRQVQWKILRSDLPPWEHDSGPSPDDWENLAGRAENWYCRRAIPYEILELIRKQRLAATPKSQEHKE